MSFKLRKILVVFFLAVMMVGGALITNGFGLFRSGKFSAYVSENPPTGASCVFFAFKKDDDKERENAATMCRKCNGGNSCNLVENVETFPACDPVCKK